MDVDALTGPASLYYLMEHQVWARFEPGRLATVGITALGVRASGDIYFCRPKPVGSSVERGRSVAVVELAKSIVSVKSPVGGVVVAINESLAQRPEQIHEDPYGAGWIARIALRDEALDRTALTHGEAVRAAMLDYARLHRIE